MSIILKILDFCNLLDYNKNLSLTNIALIALVVKLIVSPSPDLATVGSVVIAFSNYMHKRSTSQGAQDDQS